MVTDNLNSSAYYPVVRTERIVFGVIAVGLAIAMVGTIVTEGWRQAIFPGLATAFNAFLFFKVTKNPPARKPWTRRRVIASAAVLVPGTLLTLGMFGWLAIVATDGPVRIAATIGVGFVITVSVWFVRKAQRDHREPPPGVS
jgi:hypothetical protein